MAHLPLGKLGIAGHHPAPQVQLVQQPGQRVQFILLFPHRLLSHDDTGRAFDMGAADYVVKPFSPTELAARIRAALRRRAGPHLGEPSEPYSLGDLTIDYAGHRVMVAGRAVRLTPTEYELLFELSVHAGRVLTHDRLLQRVWGLERTGEPWLVREVVKRLRSKLGDDANSPAYIFTEPRVGYRMAEGETLEQEDGLSQGR